MNDSKKDITLDNLPQPISDQDMLLHNIIDGTPDIEDLVPNSREEVYLKYIALNGGTGGGGEGSDINVVQSTGSSTANVMSQNAVTQELNNKVDKVTGKGLSTEDFTTSDKTKLENIPNDLNSLGTCAYLNSGLSTGEVPVLNSEGKLDSSVIPSLALTDTFVVDDEQEMLSIPNPEKGDICIRTDQSKTYILDKEPSRLRRDTTTSDLSDWIELQTPTSEVTSVNGEKGDVIINASDLDVYTKEDVNSLLPTIVQTTGSSTTDVMSQNAVTHMFDYNVTIGLDASSSFPVANVTIGMGASTVNPNADPQNSDGAVSIGPSSQATTRQATSIGSGAFCPVFNSVALGAGSKATEENVLAISNPDAANKRRIVYVGDPLNDQDAATKGYVDNKVNELTGGGWDAKINPTMLYNSSSGSQTSMGMMSSSANFNYLEIYYRDTMESRYYVKVENPDQKYVNLPTTWYDNGNLYIGTSVINIDAHAIYWYKSKSGYCMISSDGTITQTQKTLSAWIHVVLGY